MTSDYGTVHEALERHSLIQIGEGIDRMEGRHRQPEIGDEALLDEPVLRHRQRAERSGIECPVGN